MERGGGVGDDVNADEISCSIDGFFIRTFFLGIDGFVDSGGLGGGILLDTSGRAGIGGGGGGVDVDVEGEVLLYF